MPLPQNPREMNPQLHFQHAEVLHCPVELDAANLDGEIAQLNYVVLEDVKILFIDRF